jgi:hypothetical protein
VLVVTWGPEPSPYFDYWNAGEEDVQVSMPDVASEERAAIERQLCRVAVPELIEWLRFAGTAPDGWRLLRHRRSWCWRDGGIVVGIDE